MNYKNILKFKGGDNIQGACSNQVVKCIVYTSDKTIGREKLLEIEKEKNNSGIFTTKRYLVDNNDHDEIRFSDGEEWIVVNPNNCARGYRWRRAWVDASNTSIAQLQQYILPYGCLYQWEKEKYFN